MFRGNTMKKIQWIRNGLFLLFVVSLVFMGIKSYQGMTKITTTNKAVKYYNSEQYAKAEPHFGKVINNHAIQYKDNQAKSFYDELSSHKKLASSFYSNAEKAYDKEDFKALFTYYSDYVNTTKKEESNKVFKDFDTHFQTKENFSALFSQMHQDSMKQMEANLNENIFKHEDFIFVLGKLPAKVYGGKEQKTNELLKHFKQYDSKKYSSLEKTLAFNNLKTAITKQISSYDEINVDPTWLRNSLKTYQKAHDKELAKLESERKKREEELRKAKEAELAVEKAAAEEEKANDPTFQDEIITVVNDYAEGWMDAYNYLDSSYFVNITPELRSFFEERFEAIRANNAQFTGELLYTEFDLDSFKYTNNDGVESVELDVDLTMNSATYEYGDYYEMEETSNPWYYKLINDGFGWQLSERKEISSFNYDNTQIHQFGYNY
jgi:hypothetical protein